MGICVSGCSGKLAVCSALHSVEAVVDTLKMPCLWLPTRRGNVRKFGLAVLVLICLRPGATVRGETHIYCADHESKRLIKIKEDGTLLWDCPNNNGHDVQLLKNGHV